MRHNKKKTKLSLATAPRKALLSNLAAQLIIYEAITTTEARAKALRKVVEPLITKAKSGSLHSRRQAISFLTMPNAVEKLYAVLGAKYKTRPGGYTRIVKLPTRQGDNAAMAKIELV